MIQWRLRNKYQTEAPTGKNIIRVPIPRDLAQVQQKIT